MGAFEDDLAQHEEDRHRSIFARLFRERSPRHDEDGFLSVSSAALLMEMPEEELLAMAARGQLEWRKRQGQIEIVPAVVSILGVERS